MIWKTFLQLLDANTTQQTMQILRVKNHTRLYWKCPHESMRPALSEVHQLCTMYCSTLLTKLCLETNVAFILSKRIKFLFLQNSFQPFICPFLFPSLSHQFSSNILLGLNMTAWARQQISFLLCCTECQLFVCLFVYFDRTITWVCL